MKHIKISRKGRMCKYPHCRHVLSVYNHEAYCHVHLSRVDLVSKCKICKKNDE